MGDEAMVYYDHKPMLSPSVQPGKRLQRCQAFFIPTLPSDSAADRSRLLARTIPRRRLFTCKGTIADYRPFRQTAL